MSTYQCNKQSEKRYFKNYIASETNKRKEAALANDKRKKRKTLSIPPFYETYDLAKDGHKFCKHCNTSLTSCHDVLFGMYCVSTVVRYYKEEKNLADDLTAKKVFINSYNSALEFHNYKLTGAMGDRVMLYPPVCLEQNSYEYATYWMQWKKKGMWLDKKVDVSDKSKAVPDSFYKH